MSPIVTYGDSQYDEASLNILTGVAVLVAVVIAVIQRWRTNRERLLRTFRESWGVRREGASADVVVKVWNTRQAALGTRALDDRTWNDLTLDEVFTSLDRTFSTLGREALYARLRSAPVARDPETFEALVTRFTNDVPARERAQVALARLQDPHGYHVWWLAQADAIQTHSWYALFPVLTAATVLAAIVAVVWFGAKIRVPERAW